MKNTEIKIITHELLKSWNPCVNGYERFCELFPDGTDLKTAIDGLVADNHDDWGYWLFSHCKENNLFMDFVKNGYRNSGNRNSGNRNSGDRNSGNWNSGGRNSGNMNSGGWNSGNRNSGDMNSGNWNSGYRNSGGMNSGDMNSGGRNSGNWNSGDRNSGNWNSGNQHTGFFNTIELDEILIFNKPCKKIVWENTHIPSFLFFDLTYWVDESKMTDEDKKADPNFYIRGGQLRKYDYKEAFNLSWKNTNPEDRMKVKELPNFDAKIFFEISGIDVNEEK